MVSKLCVPRDEQPALQKFGQIDSPPENRDVGRLTDVCGHFMVWFFSPYIRKSERGTIALALPYESFIFVYRAM